MLTETMHNIIVYGEYRISIIVSRGESIKCDVFVMRLKPKALYYAHNIIVMISNVVGFLP